MGDIVAFYKSRLTIEDREILASVLDQWCSKHAVERGSGQARFAEKELLEWWFYGVRSPEALLAVVEPL